MCTNKSKKALLCIILACILISLFTFQAFAADNWTTKTNMPTARNDFSTIEVNGMIYAIGGATSSGLSNKLEMYNPATNSWTTKANMPTSRSRFALAAVNNKIYVMGGYSQGTPTFLNVVEEYDIGMDSWSTRAQAPTSKSDMAAFTYDGKVYVLGGWTTTSGRLNTVEVYDPVTNTWSTKANMPFSRAQFGIATYNGKAYVIGGTGTDGYYTNSVQEYDPQTDTWVAKENMPTTRSMLGAAVVNGRIYAIGGYIQGAGASNKVEEYNINTNSWATKSNMPTSRYSLGVSACSNKVYAIGGQGGFYDMVEEYTPPEFIPDSPVNLIAISGNGEVDLSWSLVQGATSYITKRSTTSGGPYSVVSDNLTDTTFVDQPLDNGTTYYYVVTAVNNAGESSNSNEASATPQAPVVTGKALLVITMINGFEKEYDLTMAEVNAFIDWYDGRADGTGLPYYIFDKAYNKGPFQCRKDYIIFDKVEYFEVLQYE